MRSFSLKFIDIMTGIVLGLGFQWWPNLHEPWQFIAFAFAYIDIVDYWVDYGPALKKFPPKRELDVILDVAIMFSLFLFIYATQISILYFLIAFTIFRVFDLIWLIRASSEYRPVHPEKLFIDAWTRFDALEIIGTGLLSVIAAWYSFPAITVLSIFIIFRITTRVLASLKYKRAYFASYIG